MWRPDVARRRPVGEILEKKKPAAMFARARYSLDDATLPVICPTSQPVLGCFAYGATRPKIRMFRGSIVLSGCGSDPTRREDFRVPKRSSNQAELPGEGKSLRERMAPPAHRCRTRMAGVVRVGRCRPEWKPTFRNDCRKR